LNEEKKYSKVNKVLAEIIIWFCTISGMIILVTAPFIPFKVKEYYKTKIPGYETIADLGTIGDFIGGTTVAFLTAASVLLLLATIFMQRKEIKISQQSINELVKQTNASVKQAEEARKEAQITNETMKRQQFETTFFNMLTLHHNNTDKLKNKDFKGNEVIKDALNTFSDYYFHLVSTEFTSSYLTDDYEEVVDFIQYLQMHGIEEVQHVQTSSKAEVVRAFTKLNFRELLKARVEKKMLREFINAAYQRTDEDFIGRAYYEFEINHDRILSTYFNSINTIIKFLCESEFEKEDKQNGTQNNKIYREILFSQFSPHEMMMIYYFAKYSSFNKSPIDKWLLEELKTYNLFYPRLSITLYLFPYVDEKNIGELKS
jgi:hypothetical protein